MNIGRRWMKKMKVNKFFIFFIWFFTFHSLGLFLFNYYSKDPIDWIGILIQGILFATIMSFIFKRYNTKKKE